MHNALNEPQTIVLLGGSSEIGRAIVSQLISPATSTVVLAGRNPEALDPEWFGSTVNVVTERFDADDVDTHAAFAQRLHDAYGDIDVVIVAFGVLGHQPDLDDDPAAAAAVAHTNYTGAVSLPPLPINFHLSVLLEVRLRATCA